MKKKVLIDVERLKYPKSGIANVCSALMQGLDQKNTLFNYSFYGPIQNFPDTHSGFQSINWKFWQKFLPISTSPFSLVHTTHQLSDYFHNVKSHQKKVVTLHDLNFLHDNSSPSKKAKSKNLVQKNIGKADAIVCISDFVKQDFLANKHLFKLKPNVKVEVIYNGLVFPEQRKYESSNSYSFIGKPYILNIGVLFPKKNQKVLLDLILETGRDLVLVTSAAKSDYKADFLDRAKKLGLEKKVHLVENVDNTEKYFLIQNCEAYVHPSLAEGFGIPPVEAMFFGKPIFLSHLTSLPEIGGELAFYFKDFSASHMKEVYLNGILKFDEEKDSYSQKLYHRALEFGYLKMAEKYQQLYAELLD